ncbi:hypothetical protein FOZ63_026092, partial [Perkinsus olseni]
VMKIPFFARFGRWKLYTIWRTSVIRQKIRKSRNLLSKALFILNPTMRDALLAVRSECVTVSTWGLLDLTTPTTKPGTRPPVVPSEQRRRGRPGKKRFKWPIAEASALPIRGAGGSCCRVEEFAEAQTVCRQTLSKNLMAVRESLKMTVLKACARSLSDFLKANGFHQPKELQSVFSLVEDADGDEEGEEGAAEPDHHFTYTEQATTRTKCRELVRFIRTCEYILSDSVSAMCFRSTEGLLALLDQYMKQVEEEERRRLEGGPSTNLSRAETMKSILAQPYRPGMLGVLDAPPLEKPIFIVDCTFVVGQHRRGGEHSSRLEFSPTGQDFRTFIEESLMESLRAVSSSPSFLALPEFRPFVAPLSEVGSSDAPTISSTRTAGAVLNNQQLGEVLLAVGERVANLFDKVMDFTATYQRYVRMYDENEVMSIEEDYGPDAELEVYRDGLVKYRDEQQMIAAIEPRKEIGLFRLDAEAFQKTLKPNPVKCLEKLQRYIPEMAMDRIHRLLGELKEANEKLGTLPSNVEEFVHFTTYLGKLAGTDGKDAAASSGSPDGAREEGDDTRVGDGEGEAVISLQAMESRQEDVGDIMDLVKEFNIKTSTKQRTSFMELSQALGSLRNQIEFSQGNTEANINRFIKELGQEIPVMLDCVTKGFDKLRDHKLSDESLASSKEGRQEVLETLEHIDQHVAATIVDAQRINDYQEALKIEVTPFEKVDELKVLCGSVARLWKSLEEWEQTSEQWLQWRFGLVDVDKISKEVAVYQKVAMQSTKQLETNAVAAKFTAKVTAFKNTLPVVMALRNSALKERHWEEINEIIGVELDLESDELTLGVLLSMGVDKSMEEIQEISGRAAAEQSLEEMLDKVKRVWEDLELVLNPYKDSKEVFILGSVDDVITALEDSLVNISTISGSRFVGPIRDEVEEWQKNLMLFQETLDEWLAVQRNWVYLESIFSAGDIKKQLPIESAKFMEIDQHWRNIMKDTNDYSVALVAGTKEGRLEQFKEFNETLDQIQKSLEEYLHSKRKAFPRFFFLSNDELLEILAQARRVQAVQPHLRKCFDNLVKLRFSGGEDDKSGGGGSSGGSDIVGMISSEGEEIPFFKALKARGNVEKWLLEVEEHMIKSMHAVMKKGFIDYPEQPRKEW